MNIYASLSFGKEINVKEFYISLLLDSVVKFVLLEASSDKKAWEVVSRKLAEISQRLSTIEETQAKILSRLGEEAIVGADSLPEEIKLPCTSFNELLHIEDWLKERPQNVVALVSIIIIIINRLYSGEVETAAVPSSI
jgi:hypothetical protein